MQCSERTNSVIKEVNEGNYGCIMDRRVNIWGLGIEIGRLKGELIILVGYWHILVITHPDPQMSLAITSPDNHC